MLDLGFLWFQQPGWPQRSSHWAFCTGGHCSSDSLWNGRFSPNKLFKLSTGWGFRLDESRSITLIYLTQAIKSHLANDSFLGGWGCGGRTDGPLVRRSVSRFLQSMLCRWGIYLTPVAPDAHLSVCVNVARFPRLLVGNARYQCMNGMWKEWLQCVELSTLNLHLDYSCTGFICY